MLLRKWRNNSQTVLPNSLREPTNTTDLLHHTDNPKALGVHWSTTLHVPTTLVISDRSIITKRTVASDLAQVFDV